MNKHTVKIQRVGIIVPVIGFCFLGLDLMGILAYISDPAEFMTPENLLCMGIFFCAGIVLLISSFFIWRLEKKYRRYIDTIMFSQVTNAAEIAEALKIPREKALKDLQQMIHVNFLKNCYIDPKNNEFIMSMVMTAGGVSCPPMGLRAMKTIKCQSCGADNTVKPGQPAVCEYCGSPLSNP